MGFKNTDLDKTTAFSILIGGLIANGAGTIAALISLIEGAEYGAHIFGIISLNLFNFIISALGCASFGLWHFLFMQKKKYLEFSKHVAMTFAFILFPMYLWKVPAGIFLPYLYIIPITFGLSYNGKSRFTIVSTIVSGIIYSIMLYFKCINGQMLLGGTRVGPSLYIAIITGFNASYIFVTMNTHFIIGCLRRLLDDIEKISLTDELTGVCNRRKLDIFLENHKFTYAIMLDIDFFKRVNDTYGHQMGDEALKMLAYLAGRYCSDEFKLYRYGGEEFIIISKLDEDSTIEIVEAIIDDIRNKFVIMGKHITISCGIGKNIEEADAQLYKAKENGRNQLWIDDRKIY